MQKWQKIPTEHAKNNGYDFIPLADAQDEELIEKLPIFF